MIRVLIAEDEPLARQRLAELVQAESDLDLVGAAADGDEAARMLDELRPDLLFLDVRMPGRSGIAVLEGSEHRPVVVFTTAYDHYALAAFELAAADYLLKPFGAERFHAALDRARRVLGADASDADAAYRLRDVEEGRPLRRIFARHRDRIVPISVTDITRFEATDDYVSAFAHGKSYLLNIRMQTLEERLDPEQFARVHRSHIINLDRVRAFHPHDPNRFEVEMDTGERIVASRTGSQRLRKLAL